VNIMSEYVEISGPDAEDTEYPVGSHVWVRHVAEIIGYGRGAESNAHWTAEHGNPVTCVYGSECDMLVDSEGPIVRFGDGHVAWFPGQAMGCLERVTEAHENAIAGRTREVKVYTETGQLAGELDVTEEAASHPEQLNLPAGWRAN
jgi:hypothetical protein